MPSDPNSPRTTVLTAGNRLARHLLGEHARAMTAQGIESWEAPDILTWSAWLEDLWRELCETGAADEVLLTPAQELALWEQIVEDWERRESLLSSSAAARVARDAWRLAQDWRLPLDEDESASDDARAFLAWARRFDRNCRERGWLDSARLPERLTRVIRTNALILPACIELAGFDELTPAQQSLIEALRAGGCEARMREFPSAASQARRLSFANEAEELSAMAQWVRHRLTANPAARIGVVAPGLTADRTAIVHALEDALSPDGILPDRSARDPVFNVSLGRPLADYPLVGSALAFLRLGAQAQAGDRLEAAAVSDLLRSPFLGASQGEYFARGAFDVELRRLREPYLNSGFLISRARRHPGLAGLAARLTAWRAGLDALPRRQSPGRWAESFADLLRRLGWPGERGLSSEEFQTLEAWREQLGALGALDSVLPSVDGVTALRHLERESRERLYQPRSPEAPVQVLGVLEASGLAFDHLWVLGLHDEQWPPPADPNPLLPRQAQRARRMPHSSPERELEIARRVTRRLLAASPDTVASCSIADKDRIRHPSPLIVALPEIAFAELGAPAETPYRERIRDSARLESYEDVQGAPVVPRTAVVGGTAVLKSQSDCPFLAYARHRLRATVPEDPETGLGPMDRGTLVHAALDGLWMDIGSQAEWFALRDDERRTRIARAASQALEHLQRRRPFTLTDRFRVLEQQRLEVLLYEWIAGELARPPFRVLARESKRRLQIGSLELEARLDRLDELAQGERAIIDYKTGNPSIAGWFGERPADPQLPAYALFGLDEKESPGALVFGRVKSGQCGFIGLSRDKDMLPGVVAVADSRLARDAGSWTVLMDGWRQTLARLANEFSEGRAAVDPRDDTLCADCEQKPLCRIHEVNVRRGRWLLEVEAAPAPAPAPAPSLARGPRLDSGRESRTTVQGCTGSGFDPIGDDTEAGRD
jgi:probable DNA repair protein